MAVSTVNRSTVKQNPSADPQSFTGFTATTVGNVLVAAITLKTGATQSVSGVTGGGGTWSRIGSAGLVSGSSTRVEFWASTDATSSLTSITVDLSAAVAASCVLYELAGADTNKANWESASSGDSTSDTAWNSGPLTPSAGDKFLIACISLPSTQSLAVSAVTAGWSTALVASGSSTLQSLALSDRSVTADGSTAHSCAFTGNRATTNGWQIISIPAAGGTAHPLTGAVSAGSDATAVRLSTDHAMTGVSAGGSAATATGMGVAQPLTGAAAGSSAATASGLTLANPLSGTVAAGSDATAVRLTVGHPLTGPSVAGSDAVASRITVGHPLTGTAQGAGQADAVRLTLSHPLTGTGSAGSTATAVRLTLSQPLTGAIVAASDAAAPRLILSHPLSGSSAGASTAAGSLSGGSGAALDGVAAGSSSAAGLRLTIGHPLSGVVQGGGTADVPYLRLNPLLTGSVVGGASGSAQRLSLAQPLVGVVLAGSQAAGERLRVSHLLAGLLEGGSDAAGIGIAVGHALAGLAAGLSDALGDLLVESGKLLASVSISPMLRAIASFARSVSGRAEIEGMSDALPGTTRVLWLRDLRKDNGDEITVLNPGDTLTVEITDDAGAVVATLTPANAGGNDWSVSFTVPSLRGRYKATWYAHIGNADEEFPVGFVVTNP